MSLQYKFNFEFTNYQVNENAFLVNNLVIYALLVLYLLRIFIL